MDIQAAAGKGNQRTRTARPGRRMRRAPWGRGDSWRIGWTGAEQLRMDLAFSDAPGGKACGNVIHKGRWPADVKARIARRAQFLEHPHIQASMSVEIHTRAILGIGRAVAYVTVAVGQGFEECADFLGKRMLTAAASPV